MRRLFPRMRESRFRGNSLVKPERASLSPEETFRIVTYGPSFKPDQVVSALTTCSQVSSPSLTAISVLSHRAAASSEQYFPPQIVEVLSLLGKIGHAEYEPLMNFFTERLDDVLNEASPRRIVLLLQAFANLNLPLFSENVWPKLRAEIVRLLPQFKRGIPSLLASLSSLGCTDVELSTALLAQAECLYVSGEIERDFFIHSIETASRISGMELAVKRAISLVTHELTSLQTAALLAASLRSNSPADELMKRLLQVDENAFTSGRLLGCMARYGIKLNSEQVTDMIEKNLNDKSFSHKMGPYTVLNGALVSDESTNEFFRLAVRRTASDRLSADKLLSLLRTAYIVNSDPGEIHRIKELLAINARQLSVREARYLWEVMPGVVPVSQLSPVDSWGASLVPTEGPYMLRRKSEDVFEFPVPRYAAWLADGSGMRREVELRLNAVRNSSPKHRIEIANS